MNLKLNFKVLNITSRSITIELLNEKIFTNENNFSLYINGEMKYLFKNNVVTINNLEPDTNYFIKIKNQKFESNELEVKTYKESVLLNVKDFGAIGDGIKNDTLAIQTAIYCCSKNGTVFIPKGIYYIQPIFLKSDITLWIDKEAILLGAKDRNEYSILPKKYKIGSWEGKYEDVFASLINGIDIENVNIIGEGEIDGNSSFNTWWDDPKSKKIAWRPKILYFKNCKNINIEGIKIRNSPSWTIHPLNSTNLKFINLEIQNPLDSPNTDGLNPESCKNIEIIGVKFSVGDDCIAIKAGRGCFDELDYQICDNVLIRNCCMEFGHGAVTIGSEMSGGVKNIKIQKCLFLKTDRGLRIKTRRGRGGVIDNIVIEDVIMDGVKTPFTVNAYYSCDKQNYSKIVWKKDKVPVNKFTPFIGNILIRNIICENAKVSAAYVYGLPECKIERITMENVFVKFDNNSNPDFPEMMDFIKPMCRSGFYFNNIKTLLISKVEIQNNLGRPFIIENVDNVSWGEI